eukprot:1160299-Pelagomonas_calceolata.AAC.1
MNSPCKPNDPMMTTRGWQVIQAHQLPEKHFIPGIVSWLRPPTHKDELTRSAGVLMDAHALLELSQSALLLFCAALNPTAHLRSRHGAYTLQLVLLLKLLEPVSDPLQCESVAELVCPHPGQGSCMEDQPREAESYWLSSPGQQSTHTFSGWVLRA